jgi:uncharacterized protein YbaA (DUF1428 family)
MNRMSCPFCSLVERGDDESTRPLRLFEEPNPEKALSIPALVDRPCHRGRQEIPGAVPLAVGLPSGLIAYGCWFKQQEVRVARYVDGFVLPVPKKNIETYRQIARKAGKVWREHGALEYLECIGDDLKVKFGVPFTKGARAKAGETVVFSWIVYKSRAHRDRVNAKVMKDPRLAKMMDPKNTPFDVKRMIYGGFKVLVDA